MMNEVYFDTTSERANSTQNRAPLRQRHIDSRRHLQAEPPKNCCKWLIWSMDAYPAEWFFLVISLLSLSIIVTMVILVTVKVPDCWIPHPIIRFPQSSSETQSQQQRKCVQKIVHVVRLQQPETSGFSFSEWLSIRSVISWLEPQEIILYTTIIPQGGIWYQRLFGTFFSTTANSNSSKTANPIKFSIVLTSNPFISRAEGLNQKGGITWDTSEFAVMPLSTLFCTAFDTITSWDSRIGSISNQYLSKEETNSILKSIIISYPKTEFTKDLVLIEKENNKNNNDNDKTSEAMIAKLLSHRHFETTLILSGLSFFPQATAAEWKLFSTTFTYRWGTSYGVSLSEFGARMRKCTACNIVAGSSSNIRSVLRPIVWTAFLHGELPELNECPMTIDWSAVGGISTPQKITTQTIANSI